MKQTQSYTVVLSKEAKNDIKSIKSYILQNFKYREYAETFSQKIKKSIVSLTLYPKAYERTGIVLEGMPIFYKVCDTYLIFYVIQDARVVIIRVLKDRMDWKAILRKTNQSKR